MSSRSLYTRAELSRDLYSKSRRHFGATDKEWRSGRVSSRRNLDKPRSSASFKRCLLAAICLIIVFIVIAIIVLIKSRDQEDPPVDPVSCAPGFSGDNCDSTAFIGSYAWSDSIFYKLADGNYYSSGIAFRIYAPSATSTYVLASGGDNEREYPMMYVYLYSISHL